jgi:hypothetical protein
MKPNAIQPDVLAGKLAQPVAQLIRAAHNQRRQNKCVRMTSSL